MTNPVNLPSDGERLKKVLDRLDIQGAETPAGKYLAYSVTEPLFCYERDTEEEILKVIADTLTSYVRSFYQFENADIHVTSQPLAPSVHHTLPIERIEPTLRLLPSIGALLSNGQLARA